MKNTRHLWPIWLTFALLCTSAAVADEEQQPDDKNRFSFSSRFGFNISAKFKNSGGSSGLGAGNRRTPGDVNRPGGDAYNYDDGYIFSDISGSADGQTWYWGYDDSASQLNSSTLFPGNYNPALPDNSVVLSRTTSVGNSGEQKMGCDEPYLGFEVTYDRELGRHGKLKYGLEGAFNFLNLCQNTKGGGVAGVIRQFDAYVPATGTTIPQTSGGLPYDQTYSGPLTGTAGFVLSNTVAGTFFTTNTANIAGQYNFHADIFGFRFGPYLEMPITKRLYASFTVGLALNIVNANASWREVATSGTGTATRGASGSDTDMMWGGYLGANLSYQISRRWSATAGVQWQDLSKFTQKLGAKQVDLEMDNAIFVMLGLSYSF